MANSCVYIRNVLSPNISPKIFHPDRSFVAYLFSSDNFWNNTEITAVFYPFPLKVRSSFVALQPSRYIWRMNLAIGQLRNWWTWCFMLPKVLNCFITVEDNLTVWSGVCTRFGRFLFLSDDISSSRKLIWRQTKWRFVNEEIEGMWKKEFVAQFKAVPQNLSGGTEGITKTSVSRPVSEFCCHTCTRDLQNTKQCHPAGTPPFKWQIMTRNMITCLSCSAFWVACNFYSSCVKYY